jgi:hypothetical protein
MSNIDLGNAPVGTPPDAAQQAQIRSAIGLSDSTIFSGKIIFVDSVFGNDSAEDRQIGDPYLTPMAALNAANEGDVIIVRPGTYVNQYALLKNGVNWYFHQGAKIENAESLGVDCICMFDDGVGGDQTNGYGATTSQPIVASVKGYGQFYDASENSGCVLRVSNPGSKVDFNFQSATTDIESTFKTVGAVFRIYDPSSIVKIEGYEATSTEYDVVWGGGANVIVKIENMTAADNPFEEFGGVAYVVYAKAVGSELLSGGGSLIIGDEGGIYNIERGIQRSESSLAVGASLKMKSLTQTLQISGECAFALNGNCYLEIEELNYSAGPIAIISRADTPTVKNTKISASNRAIDNEGGKIVLQNVVMICGGTNSITESGGDGVIILNGVSSNKPVAAGVTQLVGTVVVDTNVS